MRLLPSLAWGKGLTTNMAQLVSTARRAGSVLDPMTVGLAIAPKLHIKILATLVSPFMHWNSITHVLGCYKNNLNLRDIVV